MSNDESPSFRLVLISTVLKLGLKIALIPDEIKDPLALVILLIREDLICSESSALAFNESPKDIVKIELSSVFDKLKLEIFKIN